MGPAPECTSRIFGLARSLWLWDCSGHGGYLGGYFFPVPVVILSRYVSGSSLLLCVKQVMKVGNPLSVRDW